MIALLRSFPKICIYAILTLALVLSAAVLGLRYWLLPHIENYRDDIVASVSHALGARIAIGGIRADWNGLRPHVELDRVQVFDSRNDLALELVRVEAVLAWRSVFAGAPRLQSLEIVQPNLEIKRDKTGKLFVAGMPIGEKQEGGGFGDLVLETRSVFITGAVLSWEDQFRGAPPLVLDGVSLHLENRGSRHRFGLTAKPPTQLAGLIDLRGDLSGTNFDDIQGWSGKLYAELPYADGSSWRSYVPLPKEFRGGRGAIRLWLDFREQTVKSLVADVKLSDTVARLNENLPELDLASLQGRLRYKVIGEGFEVASEKLSLVTRGETRTGSTDFLFRSEPAGKNEEAGGEFRANHLELAAWASLANYLPLNKVVKAKLAEYAPSGRLSNLVFKWTGQPETPVKYSLVGHIDRGAINPVGDYPGVTGLVASIDANETAGSVSIQAASQLTLPKIFSAPLSTDRLIVKAQWKRGNGHADIALNEFVFANSHLSGSAGGTYRAIVGKPGIVDINARFDRLEGRYIALYLPLAVPQHTRAWLENAIVDAKVSDGKLQVRGDLQHFPFADEKDGRFLLSLPLSGGVLDYASAWPRIENIRAMVTLRGYGLEVKASDATIFGAKLKNVVASITNFHAPEAILDVTGEASGPCAEKIRFINESPLKATLGEFTEGLTAGGNGKLVLKLGIPLHDTHAVRVNGDYQFQRAVLAFGAGSPLINEIGGHLQFSETTIRGKNISAQILGGPALINIATRSDGGVGVDAKGKATMDALRGLAVHPLLKRLSGAAEWQGQLDVHKGNAVLTVNSPLTGIEFDLPVPLHKAAAQVIPFAFERRWSGGKPQEIRASLGEIVFGDFEGINSHGKAEGFSLKRGIVSFGKPAALPAQDGLWVAGNLRTLDIDRWREVLREEGGGEGAGIAGVDLTLNSINAFDRMFSGLHFVARAEGGNWQGSVTGQELDGGFTWRPAGKGLLYARLKRLTIPDEKPGQPVQEDLSVGEIDFPALDILADDLQIRSKKLGRLELKAEQQGRDWRIERLTLTQAGATFDANGLWSRGAAPETVLKLKLDAPNVGKLLGELGFSNSMRNGIAELSGQLSWPGAPYEMVPAKLSGNLSLKAKSGQFLKVEPGAGRLLGLMSLQSLPRRITLDFRDLFSQGFAFDDINGTLSISRGLLNTKDFTISGPSAKVEMSGDVDLGRETQSLHVRVIPTLDEGVSLATGLLGGPAVGVTTFILQKVLKNPISRAVAHEYRVIGTWDNPSVTKPEENVSGDPRSNWNSLQSGQE